MEHHKEVIKNGCHKILEGINSMSWENLDDQQVHSLVMMREIARGVVDERDRKVTKNDVITALRYSIEKMVCASRDIIHMLSRMSYEGLDDQRMHLVLRMKELAHGIVDKQPRVAITRSEILEDQVCFVDEGARDSPVVDSIKISNGDILIDEAQSMMHEDEMLDVDQVLGFENGIDEVEESLLSSCFQQFLLWPSDDCVTFEWVQDMMFILEKASQKTLPTEFCHVVQTFVVFKLIDAACNVLRKEPNCVEINCLGEDSRVIVVGDIHGQFHDLLFLLKHAGMPSENQFYVFNGNYVDEGAWGIEVFLVLLAWKVLMPHRVYLLRGNHESRYCTEQYGFKIEVQTKYGNQSEDVYNKFLECFKELPLASVIANRVYTTHGGLFRSIHAATSPSEKPKRKMTQRMDLGSLADLSQVKRSCIDAPHEGPNILLSDILWSKPSNSDGLRVNAGQKLGLWYGPDCTEAFLKQHNLKLIIRSHEGPDARAGRDDFGDMLNGYSIDHDGESGKLYTLFSAPDYPQVYPCVDFDADDMDLSQLDSSQIDIEASTSTFSGPQDAPRPEFDFESLGIYNAPSWSVQLPDGSGGSQVVQVPRAPLVEGLPLPPNIEEPHAGAYNYLFELVAGLKHMIATRETENSARVSALRSKASKRKERGHN
ncbi:serine/threonine-protein phosphatase 7-like isoform X2 [Vicia villosa]|uniref:serine/threonine-protein phosphatase 7-like isoform X2 n=1 Tax=Vicia villosa TaxID=3911 RepID=UPI00273CC193|nr:serine/threonine-protein phosphatase 7-like isoform X2 [Vicia villosa]